MKFWDYGVGVLTGLLIGGVAVLFGMSLQYEWGLAFLRSNAKELISSVVTLLAASLAWVAVMRQINAQREATLHAERAKLAFSLTELYGICQTAIRQIAKYDQQDYPLDFRIEIEEALKLSELAVSNIANCAAVAAPENRDWLIDILVSYERHFSEHKRRPESFLDELDDLHDFSGAIDWDVLMIKVYHAHQYAQFKRDQIGVLQKRGETRKFTYELTTFLRDCWKAENIMLTEAQEAMLQRRTEMNRDPSAT